MAMAEKVRPAHLTRNRPARQMLVLMIAAAVVSLIDRSLVFVQPRLHVRAPTSTMARHAVKEIEEQEVKSVLPELLELAAKDDNEEEIEKLADKELGRLYPEDMMEIQVLLGQADGRAAPIAAAVQKAVERRMEEARLVLQDILAGSGEINEVNGKIKKILKKAESPMPLLTVLQLNIVEAQEEGDEDKSRALMHINTLINEELEKKASRVAGLLNKLLRMDDASIRSNILRHHLEPKEVSAALEMDFEDDSEVDGGKESSAQPLMAAMVRPMQLVEGITQMVENVDRQFQVAGAEADEVRYETLDKMREVAKEARVVIGELYGEDEMLNFSTELTPAFRKLMAWKTQQAKKEEEEKEKES